MYKPKEAKLFGAAIKQFLTERKLNPYQFAKQAELELSYVSKLLNPKPGKEIAEPRKKTRQKLAKGLGITEQELLEQIARYSNPEAEEKISISPGLAEREEVLSAHWKENEEAEQERLHLAKVPLTQEQDEGDTVFKALDYTKYEKNKDLMSVAISLLKQLCFYNKFKENCTSRYRGYRLKNPDNGDKRYKLILAQEQESLFISIPRSILESDVLKLYKMVDKLMVDADDSDEEAIAIGKIWVIPSKEDHFLEAIESSYGSTALRLMNGQVVGEFCLYPYEYYWEENDKTPWIDYGRGDFDIKDLGSRANYLILNENKFFPETWQVCISSIEILQEFIGYFGESLMKQQ